MSSPPGKGRGRKCPTHRNTRKKWCDCCSNPEDKFCGLCKLPIPAVNLSGDEDAAEENPQVDTCRCFLSLNAWNAPVEAMDCGSPPTTGFSIAPSFSTPATCRSTFSTPATCRSTFSTPATCRSTFSTPATCRSTFSTPATCRSTFSTPATCRSTIATPSSSRSTPRTPNLDVAKEAEKLFSPTEAKTKDSKDSKQSTPEMTSSSDGYPLSSEDRFTVRSNKDTPKVRKESNRGQGRKLKTSPEKKTCVKSESSSEGYTLRRRSSNMLTFGNSGGNKTQEQEKMKSSKESAGESSYTRRSSSQEEQNYNVGRLKDKFHTSPDSDNTYNNNNNERVIYINVQPPAETSNLPNQPNESDFITFKENLPFRQGYRPPFPRPFPPPVPVLRLPVRLFLDSPERFRAPVQSTSGYQPPYGGPSLMPLPKGQKLDEEKVEQQQKNKRIEKWLQTIEPSYPAPDADKPKDELLTPPTLETPVREGKGENDPSNNIAEEGEDTEIYEEECKMTESDDEKRDYPKKARREKE